jgi:hypothetical protein
MSSLDPFAPYWGHVPRLSAIAFTSHLDFGRAIWAHLISQVRGGLLGFTANIANFEPWLAVQCTINLLPAGQSAGEAGLPEGTAFISDRK